MITISPHIPRSAICDKIHSFFHAHAQTTRRTSPSIRVFIGGLYTLRQEPSRTQQPRTAWLLREKRSDCATTAVEDTAAGAAQVASAASCQRHRLSVSDVALNYVRRHLSASCRIRRVSFEVSTYSASLIGEFVFSFNRFNARQHDKNYSRQRLQSFIRHKEAAQKQ